jgi:integrase
MERRKLTKTVVDRLPVTGQDYVAWCSDLVGFGVRVRPSGSRSFVCQYRLGGRNSVARKVTIGSVTKLTVDAARAEARRILANAELGTDLGAEKAAKNAEMTVAELCDLYLREGVSKKQASTIKTDRSRIERHIKPLIGRKRIGSVTGPDIERLLRDIANGKTAIDQKGEIPRSRSIVRGGEGAATRTVRLLGGIFSWAVANGFLKENPRRGVATFKDGKGERFLSTDETVRLGEVLREAETIGLPWAENDGANAKHRLKDKAKAREVISPYVTAAIRLLILTGCRVGEILNLQWKDVDLENGVLNIRQSKTGAKKVLLAAPAAKVIADLKPLSSYVIAGADPNKPRSDLKRPWQRILQYSGLGHLRLHDLRHSYASVGAASGMGLPVIGKLLGHASPTTTNRYAHLADDPVRRASEKIAAEIAAKIEGNEARKNVVSIKGRV